ncbi:MAG TPA: ATP-binding protein [Candidatus Binatus sp.]|nr:ATP-binding protein [Candidatus Binatus sp.]
MTPAILSVTIKYERDVVLARQRARQIAGLLGFDPQDQTRIATAVSEIARNAFSYGRGGKVAFQVEGVTPPQVLVVRVTDEGPGIEDVRRILEGRYRSSTGMGLGIVGARRLMDQFDIESAPGRGTTVTLKKLLPRRAPLSGALDVGRIADELARQKPQDPVEEIQQQNQELLRALEELGKRQDELAALNQELEDTNRGVVALYAELDEKADHLRRADDLKSRFLSNMSHEFRTPVNSIQALARMLIERTDGDLGPEQERQVGFIRKAADALSELVNDLLDLAKVEAGKIVVRPVEFEVENLFGALRGMLRPLLVNESVALVFEEPEGLPPLQTDEAKVSQILRNFISNALKFTERGEVRVRAELANGGRAVAFSVVDTGIGIAPEDQDRVFLEFTQIDSPVQRKVKGTGLGLPLCRKLAELLGGAVSVDSTPGIGSTFTAVIPVAYAPALGASPAWEVDTERLPVLVVEDSADTVLIYDKFLSGAGFQVLPARTLREAREALLAVRPRAIVLDIMLRGEDAWTFLVEVKGRHETREIPIFVVSTVDDERKAMALGADAYWLKPIDRQRLVQTLTRLTAPDSVKRVLVVDDEEISRYLLRQNLAGPHHVVSEASSGADAIRLARAERPDVICLDLVMPDMDGFEILQQLKTDPVTRDIPVVIVTSKHLEEAERRTLLQRASTILAKDAVSRERALSAVEEALRLAGRAA